MRIKELTNFFSVALDELDAARLIDLANVCNATPAQVIASIVHDVLEDDFRAEHGIEGLSLQ